MIDPIIFTITIGDFSFSLYWYGVLVMLGVAVAAWLAAVEFRRRDQDPDYVWDSLLWILPAGVLGARLWYVVNATLGGDMRYLNNPISIINLKEGGLHFFGAVLFGLIAYIIYARRMKLDVWLMMDAVAPGLLLAQAIARPANFINQELYGQPTTLPWGIKIAAQNRIFPYNNLALFPEDTTRFHPTFAYEMIWNFLALGLLLWLERKYKDKLRPGVLFGAWLILAGVGRNVIEFFRPDQPTFPGTAFSYSRLIAIVMIVLGVLLILIKYKILKIKFIPAGEEDYKRVPTLETRLEELKAGNGEMADKPDEEVAAVSDEDADEH
ncbi:prolipoprotein diacylglyceryl transferase [bacterium]|nr:prolipoprotein diacylglyceryl transferase [bacterium]